jgi:hypothetical protein
MVRIPVLFLPGHDVILKEGQIRAHLTEYLSVSSITPCPRDVKRNFAAARTCFPRKNCLYRGEKLQKGNIFLPAAGIKPVKQEIKTNYSRFFIAGKQDLDIVAFTRPKQQTRRGDKCNTGSLVNWRLKYPPLVLAPCVFRSKEAK